jgi:hypothetical protein
MSETMKPFDPRCERHPDQIAEYVEAAKQCDLTPDEYVRKEEGTYNPDNGHFLCTDCYTAVGMPSSPRGWVCP